MSKVAIMVASVTAVKHYETLIVNALGYVLGYVLGYIIG